jgi:hypothetical protein
MPSLSRICRNATLAAAFVMIAPVGVLAQSLVCMPIVRGDSATSLARRLTGDPAKAYSHRFQIRDPARSVFVPKSRYERLSPHWQVCVAPEMLNGAAAQRPISQRVVPAKIPGSRPAPPVAASDLAPRIAAQPLLQSASRYDLAGAVRIGVAVSLLLFVVTMAVRLVPSPGPPPDLQRAGEAFVGAFVRPLIDPGSSGPPVLVRLRFIRRSDQLEIHFAPNQGRRYPNLLDHKRNVEYDVQRVLRLLGPEVVLGNPLRARGNWVIVPIRLIARKQAGVS